MIVARLHGHGLQENTMHKFKIGQALEFVPSRMTPAARGVYNVVQLLPEEKDGPHYRIKNKAEQHERIAHERELTAA